MVTEPLYSVVIPTFDRRTILSHTLNALAEQEDAPPFEAIVVDDGSGDGTADWLARHDFPHPFLHHVQENRGPAAARNAGVAMASGRFVAFLGDDTVPAADWLAAHHAARSDGDRDDKVAVIGRTDWHPELRITPFLRYLNEQGKQFGFAIIENPADVPFNFFYASNLSLPRGLLIEQPFDETFRHALWEDIELGYRLARLGMRIVYAAGANAHHLHPTSFERFADRQERAGYAAVALSRKHPELCSFLGLGPAGPPQAPARWRRRMVQSMARASADGPGILAPLWDAALEMQYLLGLHRGWVLQPSGTIAGRSMRRLVLHIGAHKTGTISVQRALLAYRDAEMRQDFYYPQGLPPIEAYKRQHSDLAFAIQEKRTDQIATFFEEALRNAERKGARTIVLSGERFSTLERCEIATFKTEALQHFDKIEIVYVVRDLFENCRSVLQQIMKADGRYVTPDHLAHALEALDPEAIEASWTSVFPRDAFLRLKLDAEADTVALVFHAIGLGDATPEHPIRMNRHIDFATASLLNALGQNERLPTDVLQAQYERAFQDARYEFASERLFWDEALTRVSEGYRGRIVSCPSYHAWQERTGHVTGVPSAYLKDLRVYLDGLITACQGQAARRAGAMCATEQEAAGSSGPDDAVTGPTKPVTQASALLAGYRRFVPRRIRALVPDRLRGTVGRRLGADRTAGPGAVGG